MSEQLSKTDVYPDWTLYTCTDQVVCPYCGNTYATDETDYWVQGGIEVCDRCEKTFKFSADFDITYSTERMEADNE